MSAFRPMLMLPVATLVATCAAAQQVTLDPYTTPINTTDGVIAVNYSEFATIPDINGEAARLMHFVDEPGTKRLFVSVMTGGLYSISYDGKTVTQYVDLNATQWGVSVQSQGSGARRPELCVSPAVQP